MDLNDYQKQARGFDVGGKLAVGELVHALGLAGECGEVLEKLKKHFRDGSELDTTDLAKELGDVLWYIGIIANDYGILLNDIAIANIQKLASRKARDKISGSGDNR